MHSSCLPTRARPNARPNVANPIHYGDTSVWAVGALDEPREGTCGLDVQEQVCHLEVQLRGGAPASAGATDSRCVACSDMGASSGPGSDRAAAPKDTDGPAVEDPPHSHDVRVAIIGNVDSGKSTLVGCLTRSMVDDGRGKARATVFRHAHELENGRTSSVGMELLGFSESSEVVTVDTKGGRQRVWRDVRAKSVKAVTFLDLAGHEKYLKTTVFGLTGMLPDYGLVVVGANMG
jgi:hypothetical protein